MGLFDRLSQPAQGQQMTPDMMRQEIGSIKLTYYGSERSEFSEAVGETVPLEAVTYPDGMAGQVVWASENEAVAIVRDGQVTGIGPGMTTITASIGDVVAKCTVYVG